MSYIAEREAQLRAQIFNAQKSLQELKKVPEHDIYDDGDVVLCKLAIRGNKDEETFILIKNNQKWYHTHQIQHQFGGLTNQPFGTWDNLLAWVFNSRHSIIEWVKMVRDTAPTYDVPVHECTHGGVCQLHPNINDLHGLL